ncbi:hypothetical protein ACFL6N_02360 [Thermodesulfobacteriota bacterium]
MQVAPKPLDKALEVEKNQVPVAPTNQPQPGKAAEADDHGAVCTITQTTAIGSGFPNAFLGFFSVKYSSFPHQDTEKGSPVNKDL